MKNIIAVFLVLIIVCSFVACDSGSKNTSSEASSETASAVESKTDSSSSEPTNTSSEDSTATTSSEEISSADGSSENTSSKNTSSAIKPDSASTKKDYFDISSLTGTQADVGKVVGYSSAFAADITVISVVEETTADGRKAIKTRYSDGTGTIIIECEYCHEFPCPEDGRLNCPKYDPQKDGIVTCQQCGRPNGNGYYGTCHGIVNWNDPSKPFLSCNHYSNCLKCGKLVGDGYNGTCHVTWGDYSGITTCNHYD